MSDDSTLLSQSQPDIEELARKARAALLLSLTEAIEAGVAHHGWSDAQVASLASSLLSRLLTRGFFVLAPTMISEFTAKATVPTSPAEIDLLVHDFLAQVANRIAHSREVRVTRTGTELKLSTAFVVL